MRADHLHPLRPLLGTRIYLIPPYFVPIVASATDEQREFEQEGMGGLSLFARSGGTTASLSHGPTTAGDV